CLVVRGDLRVTRRAFVVAAVGVLAIVPLVIALVIAPLHTSRLLPGPAFLVAATTWTYYWTALPSIVGTPLLVLGATGIVAGLASRRWRRESTWLALWIVVFVLSLSLIPPRE